MMKKRMFVWMLAFVLVFSMIGLTLAQEKPKPRTWESTMVKEWVTKAKAAIKLVTIQDVKAAIDKKEKAVYLDVRDSDEYAGGHLPGAISVSRGEIEFDIWDKIADKNAKIYVSCKTGARCALATKALNDMGYKNAVATEAFKSSPVTGYQIKGTFLGFQTSGELFDRSAREVKEKIKLDIRGVGTIRVDEVYAVAPPDPGKKIA
jgi:rhodanese-related sulfurtransferase